MRTLKYTTALAAATLLAAACSNDRTEENPLPPCSDRPICWDVKAEGDTAGDTRTLIGNESGPTSTPDDSTDPTDLTDPAYYLPLSKACTPENEKGYGFAVGLFGDYTYKVGDKDVTVHDLFRGTRLVYSKQEGDNPHSDWNCEGDEKYWHPDAKYIFRAYYPQKIYNYTVSTSDATTLAIVYPTRKLQYDLLLGCVTVDTGPNPDPDSDTKPNTDPMDEAVPLTLNHALAALRFRFKLGFEDADFLTSVYLLNDEECSYFSQGTVVYGSHPDPSITDPDKIKKARNSVKWLQDYNPPATEMLYKWVPPKKFWYGFDKNNNGEIEDDEALNADEMLAKWGIGTASGDTPIGAPNDNPVLMISSKDLISGNDAQDGENVDPDAAIGTQYYGKYARAYYGRAASEGKADEIASEGTLYCRNSGWLLIIPQESHGTLSLCFTTKKGGNAVYKVALPKGTEYDAQKNPISCEWKAGKRYTYTVTLAPSNSYIEVDVKPWNERKHSTEIIF